MSPNNARVKGNLELFAILIQEGHVLTARNSSGEGLPSVHNCTQKQNPALDCLRTAPKHTYPLYEKQTCCRSDCTICQQNTAPSRGCGYREEGNRNAWEYRKTVHEQIEMIETVHFTKQTLKREHSNSIQSKEWYKQGR